jgi:hypothetical protein
MVMMLRKLHMMCLDDPLYLGIPTVTMPVQLAWCEFAALRMGRIVRTYLSMTVETQRYAILKCVLTAISFWNYVMKLDTSSTELVANATCAP